MAALIIIAFLAVLAVGLVLRLDGLVLAALIAGPLGLLLARLWARVDELERMVGVLRRAAGTGPATVADQPQSWPQPEPEPWPESAPWPEPDAEPASAAVPTGFVEAAPVRADTPLGRPVTPAVAPMEAALAALRAFFTDGNLVVRVGILILFIGVAFLLKFAADHSLIPLPLRLGGVALGGLALLALGWRLRGRRRLYALLLQGAGVGVIFLTAFAAVRLFEVLGPLPALGVMVLLVAATAALAVVQDASGLAAFGVAGGFLAPLLVSTGSGSHVALFSFYALLNVGIFAIAWFKAWKPLNLEGFLFTFGVGTLWGAQFYRPEFFATVEPFLLFNFALYLGVAILFATRAPPRLRGLVDGTLVFGLPLAAFALQGALVADWEYGLAWSALGLGLIYLAVAGVLWRLVGTGAGEGVGEGAGVEIGAREGMALLTQALAVLGVAFLTIAIPLALNGRWSSALWAAQGAGLVWIGVRQARVLVRTCGWLLQAAAGLLFLDDYGSGPAGLPVLNGDYLGFAILALAGLFSSRCFEAQAGRLRPFEAWLATGLLVWGGLWWLAGGVHETDFLRGGRDGFTRLLGFLAASGLALGLVARALRWAGLGRAGMALLPLLWGLGLLGLAVFGRPLAGWNWLAWGAAFGVQWWLLYGLGGGWPSGLNRLWHGATLWLLALLAGVELGWWGRHLLVGAGWEWAGWALPALLLMAGPVLIPALIPARLPWPVAAFPDDYRGSHLVPLALGLGAWVLAAAFTPADPAPLPFLPLLNPVQLIQAAVLVLLWRWSRAGPAAAWGLTPAIALVAFGALSGWVAQGVHHLLGVPYTAAALYESTRFQAALSLCWGLAALAAMWLGARRGPRAVWMAGAFLLGLAVLKLFLVDLEGSGSVARIVSFIGVGVMMLAIGYLAPLPPRGEA